MESPSSVVTEPKPQPEVPAPQAQPSRPSRPQTASLAINGEPSFWQSGTKWGSSLLALDLVAVSFFGGISRVTNRPTTRRSTGT